MLPLFSYLFQTFVPSVAGDVYMAICVVVPPKLEGWPKSNQGTSLKDLYVTPTFVVAVIWGINCARSP